MRSSNPVFNEAVFDQARQESAASSGVMTVQGTVNKTSLLLAIVMGSSLVSWRMFATDPSAAMSLAILCSILGLVVAMITVFRKSAAPATAPIYAILQGLVMGAVSAAYAQHFEGIVFQAILLTFGTLGCMLGVYTSGMIPVTERLKMGIVAATGAVAMIYIFAFIAGMLGFPLFSIFGNGPIGIGFSIFVVGLAAFNLLLDFDFIEKGSERGLPGYFEWYGAFGLMVTLIWLYLEILRLLSKTRRRR